MEIRRIQSVLTSSLSEIQSIESFSGRMEMVYNILDREFPRTPAPVIACASTDGFLDCVSRIQIEPILRAIKKSSIEGNKVCIVDKELNAALDMIYDIVE